MEVEPKPPTSKESNATPTVPPQHSIDQVGVVPTLMRPTSFAATKNGHIILDCACYQLSPTTEGVHTQVHRQECFLLTETAIRQIIQTAQYSGLVTDVSLSGKVEKAVEEITTDEEEHRKSGDTRASISTRVGNLAAEFPLYHGVRIFRN